MNHTSPYVGLSILYLFFGHLPAFQLLFRGNGPHAHIQMHN